jgi:hypothetical protein
VLGPADEAYVRATFAPFDDVCGERAAAVRAAIAAGTMARETYTLADGSTWVPRDFLALVDEAGGLERLHARFEERYVIAADMHGAVAGPDELDDAWDDFLDGRWHAEMVEACPENAIIVRRLVAAIERLVEDPEPAAWRWCNRLRARSEHLATLTLPATALDRKARDGELDRDRYVTDVRAAYPAAFAPDTDARA